MHDALAYHMEGAEKRLCLICTLYNFLTKALLTLKKEPLVYWHSSTLNMSLVVFFYKIDIKKNGKIKLIE